MKKFCNRKRQREEEGQSNGSSLTLNIKNQKSKNEEIFFPMNINNNNDINIISLDEYSNSTLESKNDFLFEPKKFVLNFNKPKKDNKKIFNVIKEFENSFMEEKISVSRTKTKTNELKSMNTYINKLPSLNSKNSSSNSYSSSDIEYYPYEIGEIIDNQYKVIEHISDGTFGRVLKIKDIINNDYYAIKILLEKEEILKWWKYEKKMIEKISDDESNNNNHCVKIIKDLYFIKNGIKYYAYIFEFLGLNIFNYIKQNSFMGFNIVQIQHIAKQLFQGINYIHNKNIIHTDLKPENILFINSDYDQISKFPINIINSKTNNLLYNNIKNPDIKIIDFGSSIYEEKCSYGIINTRQYRAPEVILQCCSITKKTDIWSIGCILFELYTGELLFPTHNDEEQLCLIQKSCGYYPKWMAKNSKEKKLKKLFEKRNEEKCFININKCGNKKEIKESLKYQKIIGNFAHPCHKIFDDFVKYVLNIDPMKRPSASEALNHDFFKCDFHNII